MEFMSLTTIPAFSSPQIVPISSGVPAIPNISTAPQAKDGTKKRIIEGRERNFISEHLKLIVIAIMTFRIKTPFIPILLKNTQYIVNVEYVVKCLQHLVRKQEPRSAMQLLDGRDARTVLHSRPAAIFGRRVTGVLAKNGGEVLQIFEPAAFGNLADGNVAVR